MTSHKCDTQGIDGIEWAQQAIPDRPVVYVLGNHEFYGADFDKLLRGAKRCSEGSNVHFLENDSMMLGRLRILGCTLWTDFECMGAELRDTARLEMDEYMEDYRMIRRGAERLRPADTILRHLQSRTWLSETLREVSDPTLIVTHHAPTTDSVNPRFEGQISNAAFHNRLECLGAPIVAWIHGHTHHCVDLQVSGVRVLSNQRGYPGENTEPFSWDRVLDLDLGDATRRQS